MATIPGGWKSSVRRLCIMIRELRLLWTRFSPLEQQLFSAVRDILPASAVSIFDAQVAAINRVQRMPPDWSEIDFYRMERGTVNWSDIPLFPVLDEFQLAKVGFRVAGQYYKAVLSGVRGHIFDFAIAPGPRKIAFEAWSEAPTARLLEYCVPQV